MTGAALNGVTPIKNQGNCGDCWAFSTVGPLESQILLKGGGTVVLSEQYLVSCNTSGWSCNGGWFAHDYHMDLSGQDNNGPGPSSQAANLTPGPIPPAGGRTTIPTASRAGPMWEASAPFRAARRSSRPFTPMDRSAPQFMPGRNSRPTRAGFSTPMNRPARLTTRSCWSAGMTTWAG